MELETVRLTAGAGMEERGEPPVFLVAYHLGGAAVGRLPDGGAVVVGRSSPADLVVADRSLSRLHARFRRHHGQVLVEDLGSTNGTQVNDNPIQSETPLAPSDVVSLGSVRIRLVAHSTTARAAGALESHEHFQDRVHDELVRARHFGRTAAVLAVRSTRVGEDVAELAARLATHLTAVDRVAVYSSGVLEVLLAETSSERAQELAAQLVKAGPLRVGVAVYPHTATTAEALLEAARGALRQTSERHAVALAPEAAHTVEAPAQPAPRGVLRSQAMRELDETVDRLHRSTIPVLLWGETGVGKEVMARTIHERSPRARQPMVCINCGAIPAHLLESTLFGHEKGAFTGATQQHRGVFEAAHGGTVFLDEIGELSAAAQTALLRVLETRRITRVGSTKEIEVDVRIIAATHRDLEEMSAQGTFRSDLLFRLNAMTLRIPPLRNRKEEILPLAERFLAEANTLVGRQLQGFMPAARDLLLAYSWPGNVRELKNAIERAVVIARLDTISVEDLPERVRQAVPPPTPEPELQSTPPDDDGPTMEISMVAELDFKALVQRYETRLIVQALHATGGNQTLAARRLRMPLRTLVHKIKTLGIKKLGYAAPGE
ncbi:MAG: sigma 54-interacting transcriptional regulator [Myxococcota bacterium]